MKTELANARILDPRARSASPFSTGGDLLRSLLTRSGLELALVPAEPIAVVDADGHQLGTIEQFRRENIRPDQIPPILATCFILSEDRRFVTHRGVDVLAVARAVLANLRGGAIKEGGSTITQQLVKNLFLSRVPRFRRKLPEMLAAVALERRVSKSVILASYLNTVYFGGNIYGVSAAAKAHFRKPIRDLAPSEAAVLAALVRSPNFYLTRSGRPYLLRRAQRLLNRLHREGHLAVRHSPRLPVARRKQRSAERRRRLERRGLIGLASTTMAPQRGSGLSPRPRSVQLSVRIRMEHRIQSIVSGAGLGTRQSAVVAMQVHDRSVIAMAGIPYDVGVVSRGRVQPGSTFKPFVLIAALEAGYRLSDQFVSEELHLSFPDGTRWHVRNNEASYHGSIDLCTALALSDNSVFAQLIQQLKVDHVASVLRRFGLAEGSITPAVALGAIRFGVQPLALLNAYASIAAGGIYRPSRLIITRVERSGTTTYVPEGPVSRATTTEICRELCGALRETASRGPSRLPIAGIAAKTGTTKRDQVVCGFRDDVAALVWMGRTHGMHEVEKGLGPTRLFGLLAPALFRSKDD